MKRLFSLLAIISLVLAAALAISFFAPLPIPYYQDFSVMYFTDKGLLNHIPIYNYPAQLEFVRGLTGPDFVFHPYPYPPWYALATCLLSWLPIEVAARMWFLLNLGMIALSAWLLTPRFRPMQRILGVLAAIMFIPTFGLLVVGQYSAPVLLGAALFIRAAGRKSAGWTAVALLLMTFKPHIGGLLFLAGGLWLLLEKAPFARRALWFTLGGGLLLAALGFLADASWPLSYIQSLGLYRDIPGVQTCGLCASLSVALVRLVTGQSNTLQAVGVALFLALAAGGLLFWRLGPVFVGKGVWLMQPGALMALAGVLTLLIDPYLLNYDYILLLVPIFQLARRGWPVWLVYFIPWSTLFLGRNGNVILALAGLVTFFLILSQPIDALRREAYNDSNN